MRYFHLLLLMLFMGMASLFVKLNRLENLLGRVAKRIVLLQSQLSSKSNVPVRPSQGVESLLLLDAFDMPNVRLFVYESGDFVSTTIQKTGAWEHNALQWIRAQLQVYQTLHPSRRSPLFLDVGANIGSLAVPVRTFGARVIAIEANGDNAEMIAYSLFLNNITSDFTLLNVAVGESPNVCALYSQPDNIGDFTLLCPGDPPLNPSYDWRLRREVSIETLDTHVHEPVAVMKIDIEGYELAAFNGAEKLFSEHCVANLLFEVIVFRHHRHHAAFWRFLQRFHYRVSLLRDVDRTFTENDWEQYFKPGTGNDDFVAVKNCQ